LGGGQDVDVFFVAQAIVLGRQRGRIDAGAASAMHEAACHHLAEVKGVVFILAADDERSRGFEIHHLSHIEGGGGPWHGWVESEGCTRHGADDSSASGGVRNSYVAVSEGGDGWNGLMAGITSSAFGTHAFEAEVAVSSGKSDGFIGRNDRSAHFLRGLPLNEFMLLQCELGGLVGGSRGDSVSSRQGHPGKHGHGGVVFFGDDGSVLGAWSAGRIELPQALVGRSISALGRKEAAPP